MLMLPTLNQCKTMAAHHSACSIPVADRTSKALWKINDAVQKCEAYEVVAVEEYAPSDRKKRYKFIQDLSQGLVKWCVFYTYSVGGPVGNYHFVWHLPPKVSMEAALCENQKVIASIQSTAPTYHHRALRQELISYFGRLSSSSNLALLREFTAVQERRHGDVTYMAKAISVNDLIQEVSKMCPEEPVPSNQWVRLQFFPKNPQAKTASQYKSRFNVKMMVQKRQFRLDHPDSHYCAASFRYMREYAVKYRGYSMFISLDDKHKVSENVLCH